MSAECSSDCSHVPPKEAGRSKRFVRCSLPSCPKACSRTSEADRQCNHAERCSWSMPLILSTEIFFFCTNLRMWDCRGSAAPLSTCSAFNGKHDAATSLMKSRRGLCLRPFPCKHAERNCSEPRGVPRMLTPSSSAYILSLFWSKGSTLSLPLGISWTGNSESSFLGEESRKQHHLARAASCT